MRARTSSFAALLLGAAVAAAQAQPAGAADSACGNGPQAIVGRPASAAEAAGTRVGIVPDDAPSRAYVNELRILLAAQHSPADALALVVNRGAYASIAGSALRRMRTAAVGADGRFRCGDVAPGAYLAIAFISPDAHDARGPLDPRKLRILVASATVGARAGSAITAWTAIGEPTP